MVLEIPSKRLMMYYSLGKALLDTRPPTFIAYIECFPPIPAAPELIHLMYKVSRSIQGGRQKRKYNFSRFNPWQCPVLTAKQ